MLSWEPTGFFFKEENSGTVEEEGPGSSDTPTPRSDVLDPTSFPLVSLTGFEGVREREPTGFPFKEENGTVALENPESFDTLLSKS